ncbi:MAG: endo alpha-1,4 polygalactosaminidase [Candidatus Andersenbacteria bacterium]|nr:endo alpha-1,4 polygalactosaminidase [Candidatus Andersenbacteria bacterium]
MSHHPTERSLVVVVTSFLLLGIAIGARFTIAEPQHETEEGKSGEHMAVRGDWYVPEPEVSWQWQLQGEIDTSYDVDVYNLDLFEVPRETISELHDRDIRVVCYVSAGTWERFRPDATRIPSEVLGTTLAEWEDERWLDASRYELFSEVIEDRLDLAVTKACDAIEFDNVDAFEQSTGFVISEEDQLQYNRWLARETHVRGLGVGLKNNLSQVPELVSDFDFAVNEQCFEYEECYVLQLFIQQDKAVLGVEYNLDSSEFCEEAQEQRLSWLRMSLELDGGREACDDE